MIDLSRASPKYSESPLRGPHCDVAPRQQACGPDHSKAAESHARRVPREGDTVAVNIADYFKAHLANPDLVLYRQFTGDRWTDVSVADLASLIGRWQSAFTALGFVAGDRVALCVKNSVDWIAIDLAALGLGLVVVPLYVDDNPENVAWCVGHAEARSLIVESSSVALALSRFSTSLPPLHVLRPDAGDALPSVASLLPATASAAVFQALPETTLATICFTSGTSGRPKGVMLSHGNIIANVTSCQETRMARSSDTFLSILPLSHMFERTGGYYLPLSLGAKVVFSRGVAQIAEDLAAQAPTVMFAVPRIFEKFLARIDQTLSKSAVKRWLFALCVARRSGVEGAGEGPGENLATPLLRALMAKPILARLGGRLRLTVVGGAG